LWQSLFPDFPKKYLFNFLEQLADWRLSWKTLIRKDGHGGAFFPDNKTVGFK
jgi:hypothetical protein